MIELLPYLLSLLLSTIHSVRGEGTPYPPPSDDEQTPSPPPLTITKFHLLWFSNRIQGLMISPLIKYPNI